MNKIQPNTIIKTERKFFGFLRRVEHKVVTPKSIRTRSQFGLKKEEIDFYAKTHKLKRHMKETTLIQTKENENIATRIVRTTQMAIDGGKKYIKEIFQKTGENAEILISSETRNYTKNKQLKSKVLEILNEDKNGKYKVNITMGYDHTPEGIKISNLQKQKTYLSKEEKTPINYSRRSLIFNEKGKREYEKFETQDDWVVSHFTPDDKPFVVETKNGTKPIAPNTTIN